MFGIPKFDFVKIDIEGERLPPFAVRACGRSWPSRNQGGAQAGDAHTSSHDENAEGPRVVAASS